MSMIGSDEEQHQEEEEDEGVVVRRIGRRRNGISVNPGRISGAAIRPPVPCSPSS